jgi:hypothetical protein
MKVSIRCAVTLIELTSSEIEFLTVTHQPHSSSISNNITINSRHIARHIVIEWRLAALLSLLRVFLHVRRKVMPLSESGRSRRLCKESSYQS